MTYPVPIGSPTDGYIGGYTDGYAVKVVVTAVTIYT